MEASPALDDYVLGLCDAPTPKICFVPTASGDAADYITRFYRAFQPHRASPNHLELFRRDARDLREFLLDHDVIYVGGGNTANMLGVWMLHGLDAILKEAWQNGVVLCGISAGAICWFTSGVSDSFGPELCALDCLGIVEGSFCPHYDGEVDRRPAYHDLLAAEAIPDGWAADDGAAAHFVGDSLAHSVCSRADARVYSVALQGETVVETPLETTSL